MQALEAIGKRDDEAEVVNLPLIDKWLADGKYTCSVLEFARLYKIGTDTAYQLCNSIYAPPLIRVGRSKKILVDRLQEHMAMIARKGIDLDALKSA